MSKKKIPTKARSGGVASIYFPSVTADYTCSAFKLGVASARGQVVSFPPPCTSAQFWNALLNHVSGVKSPRQMG